MLKKMIKLTIISFLSISSISAASNEKIIDLTPGKAVRINDIMVTCRQAEFPTSEAVEHHKKIVDLKDEFCDNFISSSNKEACYAVKLKYLDPQALDICRKNIISESKQLECLKIIKNKVYGTREIKLVKDSFSTAKILEKFKQLGEEI